MFDSDHETDLMASVKNDIIELPDKDTLEKLHDLSFYSERACQPDMKTVVERRDVVTQFEIL